MILIIPALLLFSCIGLNEDEENRLNIYKANSKEWYDKGDYLRAIDLCNKGLGIKENDYSLNLERGMAFFKHWEKLADRKAQKTFLFTALDQLEKTDSMRWFNDDFRVHLGLGMIHYHIADLYGSQLKELESRYAQDTPADPGVSEKIEECRDGLFKGIKESKSHLLKVLSFERQKDNTDALLYLGDLSARTQDWEKAALYLTRGLEHLEHSSDLWKKLFEGVDQADSERKKSYERRLNNHRLREKHYRCILANVFIAL